MIGQRGIHGFLGKDVWERINKMLYISSVSKSKWKAVSLKIYERCMKIHESSLYHRVKLETGLCFSSLY